MGPLASHVLVFSLALLCTLQFPLASCSKGSCEQEGTCSSTSVGGSTRHLELDLQRREEIIGDTSYQPSFGIYPKGCKWRVYTKNGSSDAGYQFWDFDAPEGGWLDSPPPACSPSGTPKPGPVGHKWYRGSPRTEVICQKAHCTYHNLYYNNGRWYAIVDGEMHVQPWRFSRNQEIGTIHISNATAFADSIRWSVIPGDTLLFDFVYFIHPTAIGHWWEMLGPLFSILKSGHFKRPCDQFVLLHLQRQHLMEWVRAMIAVALGVGLSDELPPVFMQESTGNAWNQITQQLEGFERDRWYVFERMVIVKDLYTGGYRTFLSTADAMEFRGLIYQQYGLPPPAPRAVIPRVITWQRKVANRRVLNEPELVALLKTYGELQVVEYNSSSSLYEQLLQMQRTGVFVSVHTSNLANSPLLQPGSAVVEILQRHWHWNGLDTSFKDQTTMMYDIHHYAWRAQRLNQTVYLNPRDLIKVGRWPASQCGTEECVEAHTNVDVLVDIPELKALLDSRLPLVFAGVAATEAELPWPPALDELDLE